MTGGLLVSRRNIFFGLSTQISVPTLVRSLHWMAGHWWLCCLTLLHIDYVSSISLPWGNIHGSSLRSFAAVRCCGSANPTTRSGSVRENDPLIWYYSGSLRNPVTGNEIAGIEGLEFIKLLPQRDNNMSRPDPDTYSYIIHLQENICIYTTK